MIIFTVFGRTIVNTILCACVCSVSGFRGMSNVERLYFLVVIESLIVASSMNKLFRVTTATKSTKQNKKQP